MKFIVEVSFPHEPFNTFVREGTAGQKIGEAIEAVGPEAIYFTDKGVGRGAVMIVNVDDASQIPNMSEPWLLTFNASVRRASSSLRSDDEVQHPISLSVY